jgi:hypothetical protein
MKLEPTGSPAVEKVAFPVVVSTFPDPRSVVVVQVTSVQEKKATVPLGPLGSTLALVPVTVAVKVTEPPEVEGFGVEERTVVVESV